MRILVTGANGQLGRCIKDVSIETEDECIFCGHDDFDIANVSAVRAAIETYKPDCVINCAAYTNTNKAETDTANSVRVNGLGPAYLAAECEKRGIQLIHISTDFVFDGNTSRPYETTDECNPINIYGITKFTGEESVLNFNPKAVVIRTSWLYSEYGTNFVTKTIEKLKNVPINEKLNYVYDEIGSPTYAKNLASFILKKVLRDEKAIFAYGGIWHYCDCGVASRYDFAMAIEEIYYGPDHDKIVPISRQNFNDSAKRPAYSVLSMERLPQRIRRQYWKYALRDCIYEIKSMECEEKENAGV